MFFIPNGHAGIILLTLTQSFVFVTLDNVEKKIKPSATLIAESIKVPWMEGLDWVSDPSESSRAEEVLAFIRGLESRELWALKTMHALLKIERGIPETKIKNFGFFYQCIKTNVQRSGINVHDSNCEIVNLLHQEPLMNVLSDGLSSSTRNLTLNKESKIVRIMNDALQNESLTRKVDVGVKSKDFTTAEVSTIIFFLTIGAFNIAGTICDMVKRRSKHGSSSTTVDMLSKFSLYTNALTLLSMKPSANSMPAIHGIRVLSCFSVVIGHHQFISTLVFGRRITLLDFLEWKNSWVGTYIMMTTHAVDTFLVLSAFFMTHTFFKAMDSRVKFNFVTIYLHRYFRITPCLVVLWLYAGVLSHRAGSGIFWENAVAQSVDNCPKNWLVYLLYVQNMVKDGCSCLPHTWYLAVDMQLFWISPVILYPLYKGWPKFGFRVLTSCFVASIVTPAVILAINGYSNALLRLDMSTPKLVEGFANLYTPTYNRASSYLVGMFLGYDVAKRKRRLTLANVATNWVVAGTVISFCFWSTNRIYNTTFAYNLSMETAFVALSRPLWSIAIAWIIYACTQGYGGFATRFLSLPLFLPLSRLTYCIYLVHFGIQTITVSSSPAPDNYLELAMFYHICSNLVLSIAAAFVLSLFVETPVIAFEKMLTGRDHQPELTTTTSTGTSKKLNTTNRSP